MKRFNIQALIIIAIALLIASTAYAAPPVLKCDADSRAVYSQAQFCTVINTTTTPPSCTTWGAWGPDTLLIPGTPVDTCDHPLGTVPVGTNIVRVRAVDPASVWAGGREESPPSLPLVFVRDAALPAPTFLRVAP